MKCSMYLSSLFSNFLPLPSPAQLTKVGMFLPPLPRIIPWLLRWHLPKKAKIFLKQVVFALCLLKEKNVNFSYTHTDSQIHSRMDTHTFQKYTLT